MPSKKRRPHGDHREHGKRPQRPADLPQLPDRRAMERAMQQLVAELHGSASDDTPLGQAQALMYQAFEQRDERRKLDLAKKALTICPDCADAYVLLAEHAKDHKEALNLFEKGVAAGERALGPQAFQRAVGRFWGILATRPYMRARCGLANELWSAGRRDEAVEHLQDMLRLNPNDNQGVRYTLASFLLNLDRDDDLVRLLQQFPQEGSAFWAYSKPLLAFRRQGDTPEARQALAQARKVNKHVPDILLGKVAVPEEQPPHYSPGQESEALVYAQMFLRSWRNTPGAITWLRQSTKIPLDQPQPKGPLGFIKKWLTKNLPQSSATWQADFRQMPCWIVIAGERVRPWTILVTSQTDDLVLGSVAVEELPSGNHLWDALVQAMQKPVAGEPCRPRQLRVRPDDRWASLQPHVQEIGVELVQCDELAEMDRVFKAMHEHLVGKPRPGLLEMPGVTPAHVGSFFGAAAEFYRQAPWKGVGDDATIRVECKKFDSGPWYAVVMGQSGLTLGLALYEDLHVVRQTQAGKVDNEEHARQAVALPLTFGEPTELTVKDLEAVERYGWKLGGPEAYPCIYKKERGRSIRQPLAWELELMEGCLRAVPEFIQRRKEDDPAREEMSVPVASGQLKLVLSWVVDGDA